MSDVMPRREPRRDDDEKMDVDHVGRDKGKASELKIRGQAEAEKRRSKWDERDKDEVRSSYPDKINLLMFLQPMEDQAELERRESELKERALRNKVVRTRKASTTAGTSGSQ